jgi:hypothetical protein
VPLLDQREDSPEPYWRQHARSVAESCLEAPTDQELILVAHSGAGPLLPAIRETLGRRVAAYVFVDAGLPTDGVARLDQGGFGTYVRELYARGERFPNWTDAELRDVVPDPRARRAVLAELRPQPLAFWEEIIPVFPGWPDAPCGYLQFSAAYEQPGAEARRRGWAYRKMPAGHFHMLVDPAAVTTILLELLGIASGTAPAAPYQAP